jgi:hypothetical protein
MTEIWKPIDEYDNYSVSNLGNVRNDNTGMSLKAGVTRNGYLQFHLSKNGECIKHYIHRLVAKAFIPNPENKPFVDHVFNNVTDNRVEKLRWCTKEENQRNQQLSSRNTSGIKGVSWYKRNQKWCASIKHNGKRIHLGYFKTIEEARDVRQVKARELFGEFVYNGESI